MCRILDLSWTLLLGLLLLISEDGVDTLHLEAVGSFAFLKLLSCLVQVLFSGELLVLTLQFVMHDPRPARLLGILD